MDEEATAPEEDTEPVIEVETFDSALVDRWNLGGVTVEREVSRWRVNSVPVLGSDAIDTHLGQWIYTIDPGSVFPIVPPSISGVGWPRVPGSFSILNPMGTPVDNLILTVTDDISTTLLPIPDPVALPITISSGIIDSGNRTVILRSAPGEEPHTITMDALRHFTVDTNMTLILENIILDGGAGDNFADRLPRGGVEVANGSISLAANNTAGRLILGDGAQIIHSRNAQGGAIHLSAGIGTLGTSGGVLELHQGSVIRNNRATEPTELLGGFGGGIFGGRNSQITMYGGMITGNMAIAPTVVPIGADVVMTGAHGGGVLIEHDSHFIMHSGVISHNTAESMNLALTPFNPSVSFGGGVAVMDSEFVMHNGNINNNQAVNGAGVFIQGAQFTDLTVMITESNSSFDMRGGVIEENETLEHGPLAIFPRRFGIGGGVLASDNSTFTLHNGEIRYNRSTAHENSAGGGVATGTNNPMYGLELPLGSRAGHFVMNGGVIHHNIANEGGGVLNHRGGIGGWLDVLTDSYSVFRFNAGTISNNTAQRNGGGILTRANANTIIGDVGNEVILSGNTASYNGGGVFQAAGSHLTLNRARISNNTAGRDGGGVHLMTFEYTPWLRDVAYRLDRPEQNDTLHMTVNNIYFSGNTAGFGAWQPPTNAGTHTHVGLEIVGFGSNRMPVDFGSISISQGNTNIWLNHALNNYDINFRGTTLILNNPDLIYTPPGEDDVITINVDEEGNPTVMMPGCIDDGTDANFECDENEDRYEIDEDEIGNPIVIFPPGTNPDDITVNLPGGEDSDWSWDYDIDGDGNLVVTIYPPYWEVTFDANSGGTLDPDDVELDIRHNQTIVGSGYVTLIPSTVSETSCEFIHWTSSDTRHRIRVYPEEEEEGEITYRNTFTLAEIGQFLILENTVFTAHFSCEDDPFLTVEVDDNGEIEVDFNIPGVEEDHIDVNIDEETGTITITVPNPDGVLDEDDITATVPDGWDYEITVDSENDQVIITLIPPQGPFVDIEVDEEGHVTIDFYIPGVEDEELAYTVDPENDTITILIPNPEGALEEGDVVVDVPNGWTYDVAENEAGDFVVTVFPLRVSVEIGSGRGRLVARLGEDDLASVDEIEVIQGAIILYESDVTFYAEAADYCEFSHWELISEAPSPHFIVAFWNWLVNIFSADEDEMNPRVVEDIRFSTHMIAHFVCEVLIDVDSDGNVVVSGNDDYELDEDGDDIVITFPEGTNPDDIEVNLPGTDWDYEIIVDEETGEVVVTITRPDEESVDEGITIEVNPDGSVDVDGADDYEFDEDGDDIVITFPEGTNPDDIEVNLPGTDWDYEIIVDEETGDVVVTITRPDEEPIDNEDDPFVGIEVDEDGNVDVNVNMPDVDEDDIEIEVDEDGRIVITIPDTELDEEDIDFDIPEDWDRDVSVDEDGNTVITLTPPPGYVVDEEEDGNLILVPDSDEEPINGGIVINVSPDREVTIDGADDYDIDEVYEAIVVIFPPETNPEDIEVNLPGTNWDYRIVVDSETGEVVVTIFPPRQPAIPPVDRDVSIDVEIDEEGDASITINLPDDVDFEVEEGADGGFVVTFPPGSEQPSCSEINLNLPIGWTYVCEKDEEENVIVIIMPPRVWGMTPEMPACPEGESMNNQGECESDETFWHLRPGGVTPEIRPTTPPTGVDPTDPSTQPTTTIPATTETGTTENGRRPGLPQTGTLAVTTAIGGLAIGKIGVVVAVMKKRQEK